jgi:hypothetical protein
MMAFNLEKPASAGAPLASVQDIVQAVVNRQRQKAATLGQEQEMRSKGFQAAGKLRGAQTVKELGADAAAAASDMKTRSQFDRAMGAIQAQRDANLASAIAGAAATGFGALTEQEQLEESRKKQLAALRDAGIVLPPEPPPEPGALDTALEYLGINMTPEYDQPPGFTGPPVPPELSRERALAARQAYELRKEGQAAAATAENPLDRLKIMREYDTMIDELLRGTGLGRF